MIHLTTINMPCRPSKRGFLLNPVQPLRKIPPHLNLRCEFIEFVSSLTLPILPVSSLVCLCSKDISGTKSILPSTLHSHRETTQSPPNSTDLVYICHSVIHR